MDAGHKYVKTCTSSWFGHGIMQNITRQPEHSKSYSFNVRQSKKYISPLIQSEKNGKHQFFTRLRAAARNSVVRGRIWPNFKLIQALMYVIITRKYEKDPNREQPRKSGNTVFQIITLYAAMETSGWIWTNFKLIQAFIHVLIACRYEKDQMKNSGENVMSYSPL